jgi:recombination protein RecA
MALNDLQKDLIFGSVLGDGNLGTESGGRTWRYRAIQKAEHEEYLFHKYEILKPLCGSPPRYSLTVDARTGNASDRWSFDTLTQPCLKFYGDMFYTYDTTTKRWVKDVPLKLEKHLTPRALAYFYMDDGALKWLNNSNAMRICTESFSEVGVDRIRKVLKESYSIDSSKTVERRNDKAKSLIGYRIAIPEKSSSAFRELIKPYLVDCMKYKVSDGNRGHL